MSVVLGILGITIKAMLLDYREMHKACILYYTFFFFRDEQEFNGGTRERLGCCFMMDGLKHFLYLMKVFW